MFVFEFRNTEGKSTFYASICDAFAALFQEISAGDELTDADGSRVILTMESQVAKVENWNGRQFYTWGKGGYENGKQTGCYAINKYEVL